MSGFRNISNAGSVVLTVLVTGGAGFIGANFVLDWLNEGTAGDIVNVDKLTYAANFATLTPLEHDPRHIFTKTDICDRPAMDSLFARYRPRAVVHFAAESHVDRSIRNPAEFIQANIIGTFTLLEAARAYWSGLGLDEKATFRFLHVSTDEVFGSLDEHGTGFQESSPYRPNSPYSATKAGADHLVRAYHQTYGLPVLTTNCSNNYGPYQFPEKLIPLVVHRALAGLPLPIYGNGLYIRDWLYVRDHCNAIREILARGRVGETYNVGGWNEETNLAMVHRICDVLDELRPRASGSYREQIAFVPDRPGHDRRYAMDAGKLAGELGWRPAETLESGLRKTVRWYLENQVWVRAVLSGKAA